MLESPADTIFDEVFLKVHQVGEVDECHLRLHHPELCKMAWSVGILCTEGRTKGIDSAESRCSKLTLELSAHRKRCLLSEKVVIILYLAVLVLLQVVEVLCGNLKHLSGSLAVARRDDRRMEIEESMLMEICMYCHRHVMTDAHHGTESVGTQTHVGILTHILEALALLLHRIVAAAKTIHLEALTLNLYRLTGTLALNENTGGADARTCGDLLEHLGIKL